jgi:Tol biopolymer transport system component
LVLILRRCLAKNPEQRTQSAKDLRNQLEDLRHAVNSGELFTPAGAKVPRARAWWRWSAAAVLTSALYGAVGTWMLTRDRAQNPLVVTRVTRLTHDAGQSEGPTWSPDGSLLAFTSNRDGNFDVYVRRIEGGQEAINVTNHASEDFQPALSPDGNSIVFVSTRASRTRMVKIGQRTGNLEARTYGGDIWVVPTLGGQARRLAPDGNFPVWHPNGRKVAFVSGPETRRSILEVAPEGGMPQLVLASDSSSWEIVRIRYSPDASWITFDTADNEIFIVAIAGRPRKLANGFAHVWDPSGKHLYYVVRDSGGGTRLQSVAIDERTGNITGQPSTIGLITGSFETWQSPTTANDWLSPSRRAR